MIVCCTNDNAFRERFLSKSDLTLLRGISAAHAAEETRKMPARSSSPNQPPTSKKLISSVNLATKDPTKNQKR